MDQVSPARLKKIRATRESIGKVVTMLSNKSIQVRQQGSKAYVEANPITGEPVVVNIPVLPDNATDKLIEVVQGFIDHEVGHVLFTDHKVAGKARAQSKLHHSLWNSIEDTYIERRMTKQFLGSKHNLSNTRKLFLAKTIGAALEQAKANPNTSPQDYWNILGVCAIRAWAGQPEMEEFMDGKWPLIAPVTEALKGLIPKIANVNSSADSLKLANEVFDALYKAPDKPKQKPKKSEDEGKGEPESGSGKSEKSSKDGEKGDKSDKPEKGKDEEKEESDDEGDEGESESEDESGDEGESESEDESEGEEESESEDESDSEDEDDAESDDASDDGEESESDAESDSGDTSEAHTPEGGEIEAGDTPPPVLQENQGDADKQPSYDDAVSEVVAQTFNESVDSRDYLPFSKAYDKIQKVELSHSERGHATRQLPICQAEVSAVSGMIQKDLERAFVAMNRRSWDSGRRSGRLNSAGLHRLLTNDDRIFRQRRETKTKDVAVSLLVDCSGSMNGGRIALATMSAWAVAEVLDRIRVPCEVLGFTTTYANQKLEDAWSADPHRDQYSRVYPLDIPIFKEFGEQFGTEQKLRLTKYYSGLGDMSQNVDGESLQVAADRLARRSEPGKVVIVLSDGQPNAGFRNNMLCEHLRWTAESVEASGIHCVGIGIQTDAPSHYYRHHVRVDQLDELGAAVLAQVRKVVLAA